MRLVWLAALIGCPSEDTTPTPTDPATLECAEAEALTAPQAAECAAPAVRCAGDPTGTWSAASVCADGEPVPLTTTLADYACDGDTLVTAAASSASVDVAADGTFTWTTSASVVETWTVPGPCYAKLGAFDCAGIAEAYGYDCAGDGASCVCAVSTRAEDTFFGGRWEACGASLVFSVLDGTANTTANGEPATFPIGPGASQVWDFCADGDTLRLFAWQGGATVAYVRQ